jgi:bifunctional N-acetylglucosamine-1-phosphate-uridyltransferase/glucosamine-1-phosphate-acetyltransferase GlmU-like protein
MLTVASFFDLAHFGHRQLFEDSTYAWDALKHLKSYMDGLPYMALQKKNSLIVTGTPLVRSVILYEDSIFDAAETSVEYGDATKGKLKVYRDGQLLVGASLLMSGSVFMGERIAIGKGVIVESGALIKSPAVIGDCNEVRQGAYLRGYCLTGRGCVLGHVTEVKHSVFLDHAKAGHFAYVGDSILGNHVNLGAGTKLANLRFTQGEIPVKIPDGQINSGLRKFGALLGDHVQTGCNSVTNPGTILGKRSFVLPNSTVPSGFHCNSTLVR